MFVLTYFSFSLHTLPLDTLPLTLPLDFHSKPSFPRDILAPFAPHSLATSFMRDSALPNEGEGSSDDSKFDNISGGLSSGKTSQRLKRIDRVRALGVDDHVSLPQLVVYGDQSAGKSSIPESISGCPFPRQDGLCTRFPNEIVLRHNSAISKKAASLIPCPSRTPQERELFAAFSREFDDFNELLVLFKMPPV